nr:HDOD domain-containing protein [Pleionea sp. CnH1-48]
MEVFAYELLYRSNKSNEASFICGDQATARLLLNNYTSFPQATEHHRIPAFINITQNLITADEMLPIPPESVVLELLESIEPDEQVIKAVQRYREMGFKIALDDYPFTPEFEQLLAYADFVKVDVMDVDIEQVEKKVALFRQYDLKLLAEKVEDHECYQRYLDIGFDLFQGYFFEKPQIIRGKQLSDNKQALMMLMSKLYDPDAKTDDIARQVSQDAQLSYKLLRIINSASYNLPRQVQSIQQAVVFLGMNQLKRWATMLSMTQNDDTPPELIKTLLIRGQACERVALKLQRQDADQFFTAGLLSGIDSIMGADLSFLISGLPLDNTLKQAIINHEGYMGEILKLILSFEHGQWDELNSDPELAKIINESYLEAIQWSDVNASALSGSTG